MNPTKPVHKVRIGTIESAVWENKVSDGKPYYKVTFCRSYKDGDEWKTTESFGRDDLLVVAKVADQTHSWIYEHPPGKERIGTSG